MRRMIFLGVAYFATSNHEPREWGPCHLFLRFSWDDPQVESHGLPPRRENVTESGTGLEERQVGSLSRQNPICTNATRANL